MDRELTRMDNTEPTQNLSWLDNNTKQEIVEKVIFNKLISDTTT